MSLNKVMLIGNVGKDPEVRYLEGNGKMASFRLATTEHFRDRDGRPKEFTEWHSIVAWRGNADIVEKYVKKGTLLYIEGKIRTRAWSDRNGAQKSSTYIYAETIQLLGRNPESREATVQTSGTGTAGKTGICPVDLDTANDGLPF